MADFDIGTCTEHERQYEGYCKTCEVVICPSCVLFGSHKKHDILSLKQGSMYIRKEIDKYIFKGLLKKEVNDARLLQIRENNLLIEKHKAETIKKIEGIFKGITNVLKQRKENLINEIIEKFNIEKDKIDASETDWMCKQDISEKLNQFDKDKNNAFVLINSKFIMEGIRKLSEPTQFIELNIYNDLNTNLNVDVLNQNGEIDFSREYSLKDINDALGKYLTLGTPDVLHYEA